MVRCPKCQQAVRVPDADPPEEEEEPTPAADEPEEEPAEEPRPRRRRKKRRPRREESGFWTWALAGVGRWVLGVILTVVVNVLLCCGVLTYWSIRAKMDPNFAAAVDEDFEAVKFTAVQLTQDFQTNPAGTAQRLEDEFLEVTGKIQRLGNTPQQGAIVFLEGGPPGSAVQCRFDVFDEIDEARFKRLAVGQTVTVRGWFSERRGTTVILEECELAP